MNYGSRAAIAFVAGIAVGATLGILFAPAEGTETRQRMTDSAKNFGNKLSSMKDKATDKVNEFLKKNERQAEASNG